MTELALAAVPGILATGLWALRDTERFVLYAVLAAMVLSPVTLFHPGGAQVALADVLLIIACAALAVSIAAGQDVQLFVSGNVLLAPLLVFLTVNVLSLGWSDDLPATVKMIIQMTEIALVLPMLFASLPRSIRTIKSGLLVFVVASCGLAVVAFVAAAPQLAVGQFNAVDLGFGLGNKNAAGSCIGAGLVIAYVLLLGEREPRLKKLLIAGVAIEALGLVATLSRGSIVGAGAAVLIASLLLGRWRMYTAVAVAVAAAGYFAMVAPQKQAEVSTRAGAYSSDSVRLYSFDNAVEKIKARPILGTGSGTYDDFIPELNIGLPDPNNMILLTWAEIGVFGVAALIFLLVRFGRLWWRLRSLPDDAAVVGVAAGAVALSRLIHFQFDVTWTRGTTSLCFAAMGIMLAVWRLTSRESQPVQPTQPLPTPVPRSSFAAAAPSYGVTGRQMAGPRQRSPEATTFVPVEIKRSVEFTRPEDGIRVLHVVSSDAFAGLERHALRLCEKLRALGIDAMLLCPPTAERMRSEAAAAGVPTIPAGGSGRRWVRAAARAARRAQPAIVHVHDGRSASLAAIAAPKQALLVRTQHFTRPASVGRSVLLSRLSVAFHRRVNRRFSAYIAVSGIAGDEAVRRGEVRPEQVTIIPPGVRLAGEEAVQRARANRAGTNGTVKLAFAGRFEQEKRIDVLLKALALARRDGPDLRAVIAGGGRYQEDLHELARQLDLDGAVEWPGWVTEPDETLGRVHFYVNPWPDEGFGMAMAEAMSFELPVVAPTSGSSPELVEDDVTGLLVPPRDPESLAAALKRLASDPDLVRRLGATARERALTRYGVDQTAAATAATYRRVLERRRA